MTLSRSIRLPHLSGKATVTVACLLMLLKFLIFDALWCAGTTFKPFSHPELWISTALASMVLMLPLVAFRMWKTQIAVMLILDLLFTANLCYFSTYFNAIPLGSYALIGNLSDFTDSVWSSLRPLYLLFPLTSGMALALLATHRHKLPRLHLRGISVYIDIAFILFISLLFLMLPGGGFSGSIRRMKKDAYMYGSVVPSYTVFGSLIYDAVSSHPVMTPQEKSAVESFIASVEPPPALDIPRRKNVVFILVESYESWILEAEVDGKEITPNLNRCLRDSNTLYVPNVLTQVRSGRSIDGQLIYFTGLLPMLSGVYSTEHPDNSYPSLQKAFREKNGSVNYLLTGDKIKTWNQEGVARAFGIDTMLSRPDFRMEESSGKHKRIGDRALMRQIIEKINAGEIWKPGENVFMQIVTFTSHHPFRIDDRLKSIKFTHPPLMADYMTACHYTDEALGIIIDYLQSRPDYSDTMIVIVGDHEGLAADRDAIAASPEGKGVVSPWQLTPLIVLNSPVAGRYTPVIGQSDVYPTLLSLLGLTDYPWHGMGQSIFDKRKAPVAVGSRMNVLKGTPLFRHDRKDAEPSWIRRSDGVREAWPALPAPTPEDEKRARNAHEISDIILQFDYLKNYNTNN